MTPSRELVEAAKKLIALENAAEDAKHAYRVARAESWDSGIEDNARWQDACAVARAELAKEEA